MTILVAYVLEVIEFERGWGQKPDGYLCFEAEALATDFIKNHEAGRGTVVPDYYVNYSKVGFKECSPHNFDKIRANGKMWINNLQELKS